jgi:dTDP-4-dehydrorhamnose reductase
MSNITNIIEAKANYSGDGIEETIYKLKEELQEQRQINNVLSNKNFNEEIKVIVDFIERNEGEIDSQIERLTTVFNELKIVLKENANLKDKKENYTETLESENATRVAEKILKLKKFKKKALLFLENAKLTIN